jgi:hypothetical protein
MKQIIRIGIFLFTILVCTSPVHATDYNYLPPDVGIKQNEALSALEYRLQTLEALIANNPEVSMNHPDALHRGGSLSKQMPASSGIF